MSIERVAVVGAGTMGSGIVQVFARAGYEVVVREPEPALLESGLERIEAGLARWLRKGSVSEAEAEAVRGRIRGVTALEDVFGADLVIEAIVEDQAAKFEVLAGLDDGCRAEAIFASNTSSISITRLGAATDRPQRVVGMHFFNPVPLMSLVEIVRGELTSDETHATVEQTAVRLGKTPVTVADVPGFVSNRVLMPLINEAIFCLDEGVASARDIDQVLKLGMNHPMGPLALADLIGLDVCLAIMEVLHRGYGDPKYRPCPLLRRKVDAGHLGRKSGRGFHAYDGGGDAG